MKNYRIISLLMSAVLVGSTINVPVYADEEIVIADDEAIESQEVIVLDDEAVVTGDEASDLEKKEELGAEDATIEIESDANEKYSKEATLDNEDGVADKTESLEDATNDGNVLPADDSDALEEEIVIGGELPVIEDIEYDSILDFADNDENAGIALCEGEVLERRYIPDITKFPNLRNQDEYGTTNWCWAFSSLFQAEANMIKKGKADKNVDYSELALAFFAVHSVEDPLGGTKGDVNKDGISSSGAMHNWVTGGGNTTYSAIELANWVGATDDKGEVAYSNKNVIQAANKLDSKYAYSLDTAHLTGVREFDISVHSTTTSDDYYDESYILSNRNVAKQLIKENGAISASYYAAKNYYDVTNNSYYYGNPNSTSHSVAIIGWDDDFPKENFVSISSWKYPTPKEDGAWLVRDSYYESGEPMQENGYHYISYYDCSLRNSRAFIFDSADNYDNNYQYDGCVASTYLYGDDDITLANVFTTAASKYGEYVDAVSFSTATSNAQYEIKIYKNPTDGNPASGEYVASATTTGSIGCAGYYTVDLANSVYLKTGEKFAAVVTLKKEGDEVTIARERDVNSWLVTKTSMLEGQSYYHDGSKWVDAYRESGAGNIRIKAFTSNVCGITYDANGGQGSMSPTASLDRTQTVADNKFTYSGYIFDGFNTKADGTGTAYKAGDKITFADAVCDITLYAQWKLDQNAHKLIYNANGGNGAMDVKYASQFDKLFADNATFTKSEYEFYGWNTKADGTGTAYKAGNEVKFDGVKEVTLYAQWRLAHGWHKDRMGYFYIDDNYQRVANTFMTIDGKKYRFDEDGYRVSGWAQVDNKWYHFDADGVMETGFINVYGTVYYMNADGTLHDSGWLQDSGKWYYLLKNGAICTKWQEVNNKWYYFDSEGVMQTGWFNDGKNWYYLKPSGEMATGWVKSSGKWYYLKTGGVMATGWVKSDGKWYYLKPSGEMATGWVKDGNIWYYLSGSGAMQTGWICSGSKWYYLSGSGAMQTGWKRIGGKWYYLSGSGAMQTGWVYSGNKYYYLYSNGSMAADTWIGKYHVNSSGAWDMTK